MSKINDLIARLRVYRIGVKIPSRTQQHPGICDEAAAALESLKAECGQWQQAAGEQLVRAEGESMSETAPTPQGQDNPSASAQDEVAALIERLRELAEPPYDSAVFGRPMKRAAVALEAQQVEIANLQHDISRHIEIATELAGEIARLRDVVDDLERASGEVFIGAVPAPEGKGNV